jgi:alkylation response protein AidB-like acyl-CoA dehydrogenase
LDAEEYALLRTTAERILRDSAFPCVNELDVPPVDRVRWNTLAEAGLLGIRFPQDYGGSDLGHQSMSVVGEVAGRLAPALPFLGTVALFGELVRRAGRADQREEWLPRIASGRLLGAFANDEQGGSAAFPQETEIANAAGGIRLQGRKILVLGGPYADTLLVSARDGQGRLRLVAVDARAPGIERVDRMTYDGMAVSDIRFRGVEAPDSALLGDGEDLSEVVAEVIDRAIAILCAEAASIAAHLNERTKDYCGTRVAFGQPLAAQQIVRHRMVDMYVAREYLAALAARANEDEVLDGAARASAVSAAKAAACQEGRFIAQSAVQLHGAIGTTEELDVGRLFRRMTSIELMFGSRDDHLRRFRATRGETALPARMREVLGELTPEETAFRDEVRGFYEDNLTPELRRAGRLIRWSFSEFEYGRAWQQILHARGWGAPHWPVGYGGVDWTPRQRIIFAMETVAAQPPSIMMMGRDLCAPCIMQFGTEEQKAEFLPRILEGTDWWAQGYSEPQAGSDLAALKLRADSDGDDYVLNGSKIWTTFAQHANRMFCLVRTSREDRPQKGITFLLLDMDTPGIEVRPIIGMGGDHEFNEVFFTDVRIPKSRRLGAEGEGWTIARYLLRFEHGANVTGPMILRQWLKRTERLASRPRADGRRLMDDPDFARRLTAASVDLEAAEVIAVREIAPAADAARPAVYSEMINLRLRALRQRMTELMIEAAGPGALVHQPRLLEVATTAGAAEDELEEALALPLYFAQRAASIAGGTPEIHRNNIARHLFGKDAAR